MHIRVCRDCREEYRPEVTVCADCGGPLDDRYQEAAPLPAEVPAPGPLQGAAHILYSSARAADVEPLAARLGASRIPFAVRGGYQSFDLVVSMEDAVRALKELEPLLSEEERSSGIERDFNPERGYERCPACACSLAERAEECPECGLAIGALSEDLACSRCGKPSSACRCATAGPD